MGDCHSDGGSRARRRSELELHRNARGERGVGEGRGRRKDGGEAMKPREVEEETKQVMEQQQISSTSEGAWRPLFLIQHVTWCVPAGGWTMHLLFTFCGYSHQTVNMRSMVPPQLVISSFSRTRYRISVQCLDY